MPSAMASSTPVCSSPLTARKRPMKNRTTVFQSTRRKQVEGPAVDQQGEDGRNDPHGGHGEAGLGMGDEQNHHHQEEDHMDGKLPPVVDGVPGVQLHHLLPGLGVPALHLLAEAEVEVGAPSPPCPPGR